MGRPRFEGRGRGSAPPRSEYHHAKWHDWWVCLSCGAVVEDWEVHDGWHEGDPEVQPDGQEHEATEELRDRANREGNAVVEASTWRQVRDILRIRPPKEA